MTLSEPYIYLLACLVGSILITYTLNVSGLVGQLKAIKDKGENPLAMASISCLVLALAVELGFTVESIILLDKYIPLEPNIWVVAVFVLLYVLRNAVAYLVVWLYWATVVKLGVNKTKKELLAEIGEEEK